MAASSVRSVNDFASIINTLSAAAEWVVLSHIKPDGDALGSASAFVDVGHSLEKTVFWGGPDEFPARYSFLTGAEIFRPHFTLSSLPISERSAVVVLDTSTRERSVSDITKFSRSIPLINIDHHIDNEMFGTINYLDPSASSTGEIVWELFHEWGIALAKSTLEALYTAISTDCGNFTFSCTTPRTHRVTAELLAGGVEPDKMEELIRCNASLSALRLRAIALSRVFLAGDFAAFTWLRRDDFLLTGSDRSDTEFLVNDLLLLKNVSFVGFFVEDEECVRISLRSRGLVEAAEIARVFGGGGHPQAAGCRIPLSLSDALESIRKLVEEKYAERLASSE